MIAGPAEALGESHGLGPERIVAVVAHAVRGRVEPGHDRAVSRQRDRRRARDIGAANPFLGQAVGRRRVREAESVAAEPVRSQRVDGDDEHVRALPVLAAGKRHEKERPSERRGDESSRCAYPRAQEVFAVPDFPAVALVHGVLTRTRRHGERDRDRDVAGVGVREPVLGERRLQVALQVEGEVVGPGLGHAVLQLGGEVELVAISVVSRAALLQGEALHDAAQVDGDRETAEIDPGADRDLPLPLGGVLVGLVEFELDGRVLQHGRRDVLEVHDL